MTPQLDTGVIEVSKSAKAERKSVENIYRAKHFPSQNGTYGDRRFYSDETNHLSIVTNEKSRFFKPLLT